ncbi:hypothetical protein [Kribbella speibonae]|uniref:UDP-glucose/GDP-mannose dehydrogenase family protein n=1 Tax=Kribbella speibonae TaxID=1572660 RepID=A0A4R0IXC9_9ACTN|nr:hypothetical protein [Kribbella speibonae]TCC36316.1 hypothetical protein E0H92_27070 [Kribbella speibonae]
MAKFIVIGRGYVGSSIERFLSRRYDVESWDILDETPAPYARSKEFDAVFLCLPTPQSETGEADITAIEKTLGSMQADLFVLKSTVPPGTVDALSEKYGARIVFWPEYIGESKYANPYFPTEIADEPFAIIGGEATLRSRLIDILIPVMGPTVRYHQCSALEAELAKYAENTFFATKVTFCYEFAHICGAFGADWHAVREAWLCDPRINPMHTAVFRDDPGFGGKCLPKDLAAILHSSETAGYFPVQLRATQAANAIIRGEAPGEAQP